MTVLGTPRIGPLPVAEWTEDDRAALRGNLPRAERYLTGEADPAALPPILGLFARHPRVCGPWLAFGGALLDAGALDPVDRELLILRVSVRTRCAYLWAEHVPMAAKAGLAAEQVAALADAAVSDAAVTDAAVSDAVLSEAVLSDAVPSAHGDRPLFTERDLDLLRAADQLVAGQTVDDPTWQRLTRHFDERRLLELTFVVGSYTCLAMVLNSVGLQPAAHDQAAHDQEEETHAAFPEAAGR